MKARFKDMLKVINRFLYKYLDADLTVLLLYIVSVATICFFIDKIGGDYTTFICICIGVLLGKACGVFIRRKHK